MGPKEAFEALGRVREDLGKVYSGYHDEDVEQMLFEARQYIDAARGFVLAEGDRLGLTEKAPS